MEKGEKVVKKEKLLQMNYVNENECSGWLGLQKPPVDKPVENVEKCGFSTDIFPV